MIPKPQIQPKIVLFHPAGGFIFSFCPRMFGGKCPTWLLHELFELAAAATTFSQLDDVHNGFVVVNGDLLL